jgi:hypothetical protein
LPLSIRKFTSRGQPKPEDVSFGEVNKKTIEFSDGIVNLATEFQKLRSTILSTFRSKDETKSVVEERERRACLILTSLLDLCEERIERANHVRLLTSKFVADNQDTVSVKLLDLKSPPRDDSFEQIDLTMVVMAARDESLARVMLTRLSELATTYGLEEITARAGDEYNPTIHDDRGLEPVVSDYPMGSIAGIIRKGYKLSQGGSNVVIRQVWVQLSKGGQEKTKHEC